VASDAVRVKPGALAIERAADETRAGTQQPPEVAPQIPGQGDQIEQELSLLPRERQRASETNERRLRISHRHPVYLGVQCAVEGDDFIPAFPARANSCPADPPAQSESLRGMSNCELDVVGSSVHAHFCGIAQRFVDVGGRVVELHGGHAGVESDAGSTDEAKVQARVAVTYRAG